MDDDEWDDIAAGIHDADLEEPEGDRDRCMSCGVDPVAGTYCSLSCLNEYCAEIEARGRG